MISILHGYRECLIQSVSGETPRHRHAIRLALLKGSNIRCVEKKPGFFLTIPDGIDRLDRSSQSLFDGGSEYLACFDVDSGD